VPNECQARLRDSDLRRARQLEAREAKR